MRYETMGGLGVRILGGVDGRGGGDGPAIVLLHGFGGRGNGMVELGHLLDVPASVRFICPEGPLALPDPVRRPRGWWMMDLERLERDRAQANPPDRSTEVPAGLAAARDQVGALLDELPSRLGGACEPWIVGGFSQGAMLACDIACTTPARLAALVLMSGTMISAAAWLAGMPRRAGLAVFQSHGRDDPSLPIAAAEALRDHLRHAGLNVSWHEFDGGHEVPPTVLAELSAFLRAVIDR